MSEYYDGAAADVATEFVDLDGDGQPDVTLYDLDGDGYADAYGYFEQAGVTAPDAAGYDAGYGADGTFYANDNLDTGISTSADGSAGYIDLGDGQSYSWG
jgi:hypothetical protein